MRTCDASADNLGGMEDPNAGSTDNRSPAGHKRPPAAFWVRAGAIAVVAIVAAFFLLKPAEEESSAELPSFSLPLLSSEGRITSEELAGKPVVINFWASWCTPCREEAPLFERMWNRYRDRGLVILGVDVQDSEDNARSFVEDLGLTYPIVKDLDRSYFKQVSSIDGLPQTFFVDASGELVGKHTGDDGELVLGAIDPKDLETKIEDLLDRSASPSP